MCPLKNTLKARFSAIPNPVKQDLGQQLPNGSC
jgi:hypothetical protein